MRRLLKLQESTSEVQGQEMVMCQDKKMDDAHEKGATSSARLPPPLDKVNGDLSLMVSICPEGLHGPCKGQLIAGKRVSQGLPMLSFAVYT
jgi:hypothetical protein